MWVFELDRPDVLAFKQRVLAEQEAVARCERRALSVDLREDWGGVLVDAGLRPGEPTAWLAEGLLTYLSADEADRLLTVVSDLSTPGSRVAFEFDALGTEGMRAEARAMPAMAEYVELWKGGLPDAPDWLSHHGWRPEVHRHAKVAIHYKRAIVEPSTGGFVTATRG
jgi:methyltransferase (TIGR00027 family)